ncbi:MAG: hypothetical protein H6618_07930 [Deltaproteobacteria bacterium]|nr:hypothetical protein [Deltaproteobacteria bacterium]
MKWCLHSFFTAFLSCIIYADAYAMSALSQVSGLYNAVLKYEGTDFYQYAKITLRTVNPEGQMKISANIRVFFGEENSSEYLTYEFDEVPLNILTRQLSIKSEGNDISMIAFLKGDLIEGEWFSTLMGKVGSFRAQKNGFPSIEEGSVLVEALSGHYRGNLENTNPDSNLPEKVSFSFVTTQDNSNPESPSLHISGNTRFYLGDFNSLEYIEVAFDDIQFNFYNRFLTAKTKDYGFTFKGRMTTDGTFEGELFSDGLGDVGLVQLEKVNRHQDLLE